MMEKIDEAVKEKAQEGRISCHQLRALAEELGVPYNQAGEAANRNDIKIFGCELGCF